MSHSIFFFNTAGQVQQAPQGAIGISHTGASLPTRAEVEQALPIEQNAPVKGYDVFWFGGSHGDASAATGAPLVFNGVHEPGGTVFLKVLRSLGLTAKKIVADFCYSLAYLPEFADLLTDDGVFVGFSGIGQAQRTGAFDFNKPLACVRMMVKEYEENLKSNVDGPNEDPSTVATSQVAYIKRSRQLLRYDDNARQHAPAICEPAYGMLESLQVIARVGNNHNLIENVFDNMFQRQTLFLGAVLQRV